VPLKLKLASGRTWSGGWVRKRPRCCCCVSYMNVLMHYEIIDENGVRM
jgi:hypothetical protein